MTNTLDKLSGLFMNFKDDFHKKNRSKTFLKLLVSLLCNYSNIQTNIDAVESVISKIFAPYSYLYASLLKKKR